MSAPNILYIMADDHAANAISAYDSILADVAPTPNIDRIAENGLRMNNCECVNSICSPSRANILTGQHCHVNGVRTLSDHLPKEDRLISEIFQENGYQTALFGKWHLHAEPRGFDQWITLPGQGLYHDPIFNFRSAEDIPEGGQMSYSEAFGENEYKFQSYKFGHMGRINGYVTDVITDMTLDWLEKRDQEEPFFLCCHHKAPHDFFGYPHRLDDYLKDVELPEPETLFEDEEALKEISRKYGSTMSDRWEPRNAVKHLQGGTVGEIGEVDFDGLDFKERARKAYQFYVKEYLRACSGIDENVGRILDYLEETGLAENTLVIYTSDQGMLLGEHDKIDKRWFFEESQQMPFLAQLPGKIPAGTVSDALVDNTDFAPTLLNLAGLSAPDSMQGTSFEEVLANPELDGKDAVYYRYWMHMAHHWVPSHYGIRTKDYKLIFFYGMKLDAAGCPQEGEWSKNTEPGFELYDLVKDPLEKHNVYRDPDYADIAADLKQQLLALKEEIGDTDENYPELRSLQKHFF